MHKYPRQRFDQLGRHLVHRITVAQPSLTPAPPRVQSSGCRGSGRVYAATRDVRNALNCNLNGHVGILVRTVTKLAVLPVSPRVNLASLRQRKRVPYSTFYRNDSLVQRDLLRQVLVSVVPKSE